MGSAEPRPLGIEEPNSDVLEQVCLSPPSFCGGVESQLLHSSKRCLIHQVVLTALVHDLAVKCMYTTVFFFSFYLSVLVGLRDRFLLFIKPQ